MSSTGQPSSSSYYRLIVDAQADYANQTGIDLSKSLFTEKIKLLNSPQAIVELLKEREKTFKGHPSMNRRLIGCIGSAVAVLHGLSGILSDAVSRVSQSVTYSESFNVASSGPVPPSTGCVYSY